MSREIRNHKPVSADKLTQYVKQFPAIRLLVVGDVMLDHYIWGRVDRISPEAPVPVVEVSHESLHLGGAANVAHNIVSLGGKADLCGVIGEDDFGHRILQEMKRLRLTTEGIIPDRSRPTTKKTRVIAHNQQVVRFDHEQRQAVSEKVERAVLEFAHRRIRHVNGLVVSDYAKGMITERIMSDLIGLAHQNRVPIIVDPKVGHIPFYKGAHLITPNAGEALRATGIQDGSDSSLVKAGRILLERLGCDAILITRGEEGMSLFEKNGHVTHIPTVAREVYDVTGAGDTVISAMALSLCAGAGIQEAAILANTAAGIVVGVIGTATVYRGTLTRFLRKAVPT